jgi:membrane-anchored mycosin MYCP
MSGMPIALITVAAVAGGSLIGVTSAHRADAMPPPVVDPAFVPTDGPPGPEQPMRQSTLCGDTVSSGTPDVALPAPGFTMLNIRKAWEYSTGNGVLVAVIDTGVSPSPRLPVVAGGDYVLGGDGLDDCDAHGTIVASVIAAAPRGIAMPPPMPPTPASLRGMPAPPDRPRAGSAVPGPPDGVAGVAPHSTVVSIRQTSRAFRPAGAADEAAQVSVLARAIVRAANLGAKVINVGVTTCVAAGDVVDHRPVGAAVWYAATVKDAVVVAAAGDEGDDGCARNLPSAPAGPGGVRGWDGVRTVSLPSVYSEYVLSVGAITPGGRAVDRSLSGPWLSVAAPGSGITGLAPRTGAPVNSHPPNRPGEPAAPFQGTGFAAGYVSGIAALVRARFPELSARQVTDRIRHTAHNPPGGVDERTGHGVVDAVAALTFDVTGAADPSLGSEARPVPPPTAPPPPDHRARHAAIAFTAAVGAGMVIAAVLRRARQARR